MSPCEKCKQRPKHSNGLCRKCWRLARGMKPNATGLSLAARLARKSKRDEKTGCLNWLGANNGKGYGQLRINRRPIAAHRLAWTLAKGEVPDGLSVLHQCDNPRCIEVSHLFLGTQLDNIRDCKAKGRLAMQKKHDRPRAA